jgi:hypothetical protein
MMTMYNAYVSNQGGTQWCGVTAGKCNHAYAQWEREMKCASSGRVLEMDKVSDVLHRHPVISPVLVLVLVLVLIVCLFRPR